MLPMFPSSLSDKYRPRRLKDFIGIKRPVAVMRALAAKPRQSAWFLLGSSGIGKTSLALAFAEEIKAEMHHIPSQQCDLDTIENVCSFCNYIPLGGGFHVIIADEADKMSSAAQLALLSRLDPAVSMPPRTIFFFTANSAQRLEDRFLSRTRVLVFEQDDMEKELPAFLANVYKQECRRSLPLAICEKIAKESNNNVREALMVLEVELMARAAEETS